MQPLPLPPPPFPFPASVQRRGLLLAAPPLLQQFSTPAADPERALHVGPPSSDRSPVLPAPSRSYPLTRRCPPRRTPGSPWPSAAACRGRPPCEGLARPRLSAAAAAHRFVRRQLWRSRHCETRPCCLRRAGCDTPRWRPAVAGRFDLLCRSCSLEGPAEWLSICCLGALGSVQLPAGPSPLGTPTAPAIASCTEPWPPLELLRPTGSPAPHSSRLWVLERELALRRGRWDRALLQGRCGIHPLQGGLALLPIQAVPPPSATLWW
mmetsp:Transcript_11125/g.33349  ORF Transcript_11125/g.33349 Transcript_11125/m.33349 type:complete len:265 (-) Transcript_11125:1956-2750(-)